MNSFHGSSSDVSHRAAEEPSLCVLVRGPAGCRSEAVLVRWQCTKAVTTAPTVVRHHCQLALQVRCHALGWKDSSEN